MDKDGLIGAIEKLNSRKKYIDSFCYIKDGDTLFEEYFNGYDRDSLHHLYSVTKSVVALLIGKLIELELLQGVDTKIIDILPKYNKSRYNLEQLTLHHVLTMTEGLAWDEMKDFNKESGYVNQIEGSESPLDFIFSLDNLDKPGDRYRYSSGSSQILVEVIEELSKTTCEEFAIKYLFRPLEIDYQASMWRKNKLGQVTGGYGLSLRIKDYHKIAALINQSGYYNGNEVITKSWIEELGKNHTDMNRGYSGYGYHFWRTDNYFQGRSSFGAFGHRGQRIFHFPKLKATIAISGNLVKPTFGIQEALIKDYIFY